MELLTQTRLFIALSRTHVQYLVKPSFQVAKRTKNLEVFTGLQRKHDQMRPK